MIHAAAFDRDGKAAFHVVEPAYSSSLYPIDPEGAAQWKQPAGLPVMANTGSLMVDTVRLDSVMRRLGLERIDYLKIDTQGADMAVLRGLGDRLRDVGEIVMEVQLAPVEVYKGDGMTNKNEVLCKRPARLQQRKRASRYRLRASPPPHPQLARDLLRRT